MTAVSSMRHLLILSIFGLLAGCGVYGVPSNDIAEGEQWLKDTSNVIPVHREWKLISYSNSNAGGFGLPRRYYCFDTSIPISDSVAYISSKLDPSKLGQFRYLNVTTSGNHKILYQEALAHPDRGSFPIYSSNIIYYGERSARMGSFTRARIDSANFYDIVCKYQLSSSDRVCLAYRVHENEKKIELFENHAYDH